VDRKRQRRLVQEEEAVVAVVDEVGVLPALTVALISPSRTTLPRTTRVETEEAVVAAVVAAVAVEAPDLEHSKRSWRKKMLVSLPSSRSRNPPESKRKL